MSEISYSLARAKRTTSGVAYHLRVLRVVGGIDFKAKYADNALGYVWSVAKPLAYFGVLWLVFAHLLRTANQTTSFPLWLLIGILLFTFLVDIVTVMLPSMVEKGMILRRLAFPPVLVPVSESVGVCITFCINLSVFVVFIAVERVLPRWEWLLAIPLLAELYVFCLGLGLLLAALFVRFRDIGQLWEVMSQALFFASGIFYPIGIIPDWAQKVAFLNPFVQIMQDMRHVVLAGASGPYDLSADTVYAHAGGRLIPIAITFAVFFGALALFRRESRYFAERI